MFSLVYAFCVLIRKIRNLIRYNIVYNFKKKQNVCLNKENVRYLCEENKLFILKNVPQ